jgi:PKD repeat protein
MVRSRAIVIAIVLAVGTLVPLVSEVTVPAPADAATFCTLPPTGEAGPCAAFSALTNPLDTNPQSVTFDGTASRGRRECVATTGPEVCTQYPVESWTWDFGDGNSASGPVVEHLFREAGTYLVRLTVTSRGRSASTTEIVVIAPNHTPTISSFTASVVDHCGMPRSPEAGKPVRFRAVGHDVDPLQGQQAEFSWGEGPPPPPNTIVPPSLGFHYDFEYIKTHTYAAPGTYVPQLRVRDSKYITYAHPSGLSAWRSLPELTLVVGPTTNWEPIARMEASPTSGTAPLTVFFDGSESCEPEGTTLTYKWDFGDGSISTGPTTTHTYAMPGTYTAKLTVIDTGGASAVATAEIIVNAPDRLAIAAPDIAWVDRPTRIYAEASGTTAIAALEWDVNGDEMVDATTPISPATTETAQTLVHTYNAVGRYRPAVRSVSTTNTRSEWARAGIATAVVDPNCSGDTDSDGIPCYHDHDDTVEDPPVVLERVRLQEGLGLVADGLVPLLSDAAAVNPLNLQSRTLFRGTRFEVRQFTGPFMFVNADIFGTPGLRDVFIHLWSDQAFASCTQPLIGDEVCDKAHLHGRGLCLKAQPFALGICRYHAQVDDDEGWWELLDGFSLVATWSGQRIAFNGTTIPFTGELDVQAYRLSE